MGYASAAAVILLLLVAGMTFIQLRLDRSTS
jgi:ABC-type sugar transport system permease subunit